MAITPTGDIFKGFEFDELSSKNYGIYITGNAVYNAPERDVEMLTIPGRNGTFALDQGRFENIEVTYPAGIFTDTELDFAEAISDLRNYLCSKKGYCRLTDEYNPTEYRMAVYKSGLEVTPAQLKAGQFNITFDCKPQRFLTSGEEAIDMGEIRDEVGTNNEPYLFRASPQLGDYNAEQDMLVGGTVAWNQLCNGSSVTVPSGHKYYMIKSGTASIGTSAGSAITGLTSGTDIIIDLTQMFGSTIADYIYSLETANAGAGVAWFRKLGFNKPYYSYSAGELKSVSGLVSHDMTGFNQCESFMTNESQNRYSSAMYAQIKLLPSTTYAITFNGANGNRYYSNENLFNYAESSVADGKATIVATTKATISEDSNAQYDPQRGWIILKNAIAQPSAHNFSNVCINISWDGSRDGEYEPYELHSYPLDTDLTLRGIPKLDANNSLYYDGDVYEADGTVTRKYGIVDLGTLTYTKAGAYHDGEYKFQANLVGIKPNSAVNHVEPVMCSKYVALMPNDTYLGVTGISVETSTYGYIGIHDSAYDSSTADQFKTAMSGVYLVYELATPTTETADPYEGIQTVSPDGTEQYVSTSIVPVGHQTKYGTDPRQLVNPTLFEASPMLEVTGYGNIGINDESIVLADVPLGEIKIGEAVPASQMTLDMTNVLTGDTIYQRVDGGVYEVTMRCVSYSASLNLQVTGYTDVASVVVSGNYSSTVKLTIKPAPFEGVAGTLKQSSSSVDLSFKITNGGTTTTTTGRFWVLQSYDGNNGFYAASGETDFPARSVLTLTKRSSISSVYAFSTVSVANYYIDLDIGEAYGKIDDEYYSLNSTVEFPSKLPTLKAGTNTITYDNTITDFKIVPRWWKI